MKVIVQMILALSVVVVSLSPALAVEDPNIAILKKALLEISPGTKLDKIQKSPIPGLYEVVFGSQVIYVTGDGKYMLKGDLLDLKSRVNLTEESRQVGRMKSLQSLDENYLVIFQPQGKKADYVVTVFTDIDCGYCRKLHAQIKEYNKLGIEIRYAAYPRSGLQTPSYDKAVAVWCAEDRKEAMTSAKSGAKLEQLKQLAQVKGSEACQKSVDKQYKIARSVGISGTPTLFMENGKMIPGYVPPERLLKILESPGKT